MKTAIQRGLTMLALLLINCVVAGVDTAVMVIAAPCSASPAGAGCAAARGLDMGFAIAHWQTPAGIYH